MTLFEPDGQYPIRPRERQRRRGGRVWAVVVAVVAVAVLLVLAPWDPYRGQAMADQVTIWLSPSPAEISALADATGMSETGRQDLPRLDPGARRRRRLQHPLPGRRADRARLLHRAGDLPLPGHRRAAAGHQRGHGGARDAARRLRTPSRVRAGRGSTRSSTPSWKPCRTTTRSSPILQSYPAESHADELHSRLGTEITELTPELETYFGRYFDDRSLVLAEHAHSTAALDAANARIAELTAQLDALGADIEARRSAWDADSADLDADIERYNAAGWTPTSDREYRELQNRWDAREAARLALVADIDRYNALVAELNELSAASNELYQELDSMAGAREPAP